MSESLCSTMNVCSPKQWDTKHGVTQYFWFTVDMFFVLEFFTSLICVWLEKTTVLFICIHKQVKSIVFVVFIKFCDESGLEIFSMKRTDWQNSLNFNEDRINFENINYHYILEMLILFLPWKYKYKDSKM